MKPIKPSPFDHSLIAIPLTQIHVLNPKNISTFAIDPSTSVDAFCLLCPGKKCLSTKFQDDLNVELCPASAITLDKELNSIKISEACFGCGLCTVACPIGAIHINETDHAVVGSTDSTIVLQNAKESDWEHWISGKQKYESLTAENISELSDYLADKCINIKGNYFYKTIESILRLLGYDAKMSNLGDTSNRIDLIIRSEQGNIPVEIKSYVETPTINLKSIQQALENKLLISRLDGAKEISALSSLAIGFSYPTERTGIEEHIKEIERAYGIKVGLASLTRLWELLLTEKYSKMKSKKIDLANLRGLL
jgi:Fe-S-cluster-containing hydrogenase component 2